MSSLFDTGFDFADLVDDVVERSGGETATAEDIVKIRRSLKIVLERWAALRMNTWRVETVRVVCGGTGFVQLPKTCDDVFQVNAVMSGGDSESPMARVSADKYSMLTTKNTQGQPSQYYLDRTVPPTLYYYPIGSTFGVDYLNVWFVNRPAAFDRTSNDVDVPGRWLEALTSILALDLARKRPIPLENGGLGYNEGLIKRLKMEADEATIIAQNADRQRVKYTFRIGGLRR